MTTTIYINGAYFFFANTKKGLMRKLTLKEKIFLLGIVGMFFLIIILLAIFGNQNQLPL